MTLSAIADYYDRHWKRRMEKEPCRPDASWRDQGVLRMLVERAPPPAVVLDVGCGIGLTLQYLATIPAVQRLIGVEPSPVAAEEARRRFPQAEIHVGFAEAMDMIPTASCDAVVALAVLEHLYDTHRALNEFNRVLKPGGSVAVYTTDFNLLKKVLVALFAFERCFDVGGGHIRFFTRSSLAAVMREHGFEPVAMAWDGSYFGVMPTGQNALFRKVRDVAVLRETC
jgi:ubiquinone/menaquinone biosynthesis C-methylase UbiE